MTDTIACYNITGMCTCVTYLELEQLSLVAMLHAGWPDERRQILIISSNFFFHYNSHASRGFLISGKAVGTWTWMSTFILWGKYDRRFSTVLYLLTAWNLVAETVVTGHCKEMNLLWTSWGGVLWTWFLLTSRGHRLQRIHCVEIFTLLGCYAENIAGYGRFETTYRCHLLDSRCLLGLP